MRDVAAGDRGGDTASGAFTVTCSPSARGEGGRRGGVAHHHSALPQTKRGQGRMAESTQLQRATEQLVQRNNVGEEIRAKPRDTHTLPSTHTPRMHSAYKQHKNRILSTTRAQQGGDMQHHAGREGIPRQTTFVTLAQASREHGTLSHLHRGGARCRVPPTTTRVSLVQVEEVPVQPGPKRSDTRAVGGGETHVTRPSALRA